MCLLSNLSGGDGGIRTLAPVSQPTPLAGEPLIASWVRLQNKMAPQVGFEPTTYRLTAGCSTTELLRNDFAWQRPILTGGDPPTTFGAETLNFRVRHGNGCGRLAIATRLYRACSLKTEDSSTQTIRLDQSLDRLVSFSSTCHHASTHDLSTSSSLRGLS